jgi:serine/threonine protein phosphatase PrpC
VRFAIGHATDQGLVRDNNEDAFLVDGDHALYAVADGMGGHRGGEVASRTAIEAIRAAFASGAAIDAAIEQANTAVITRAAGNDDLLGMGTTLTAVTVSGPAQLLFGHVGDSRAYVMHDGELRRVTDDHSLVEDLVREGRLTPEQAEVHPQKAIVTRALGVDVDVQVALYHLDVGPGDRILICSDGLTDMLRDREIESILYSESNPQRAAEVLVRAANDAGGVDNITVVIVDVMEVDDPPEPADAVEAADATNTAVASAAAVAPKPERHPWRTLRNAVLILLPVVLILGVAAGVLGWYARRSYYVGAAGNEVVIYKGVPGGVLGWDPTVDRRTGIRFDELSQLSQANVRGNTTRGSLATTEAYVARLEQEVADAATTTTTTTTTTVPKRPATSTTVKRP